MTCQGRRHSAVASLLQSLDHRLPSTVVLPGAMDKNECVTHGDFLVFSRAPFNRLSLSQRPNGSATFLFTVNNGEISLVLGIGLAVLICKSRLVRDALYPNIVLFQLIPKIALAPLFIVWLGIGSTSRITFAVFISFFPVVVATLTGLTSVDRDLLRLCKAVGADESRIYAKVRFPAAVPHLFSGLKIAITFAMIGVIVGEFITAQAGLGYMILFAASQAEMTLIFASIVVLCAIGLVLYGLVVMAEALALKRYGA
jgi:NitT/TauT family transport system permease protein